MTALPPNTKRAGGDALKAAPAYHLLCGGAASPLGDMMAQLRFPAAAHADRESSTRRENPAIAESSKAAKRLLSILQFTILCTHAPPFPWQLIIFLFVIPKD